MNAAVRASYWVIPKYSASMSVTASVVALIQPANLMAKARCASAMKGILLSHTMSQPCVVTSMNVTRKCMVHLACAATMPYASIPWEVLLAVVHQVFADIQEEAALTSTNVRKWVVELELSALILQVVINASVLQMLKVILTSNAQPMLNATYGITTLVPGTHSATRV